MRRSIGVILAALALVSAELAQPALAKSAPPPPSISFHRFAFEGKAPDGVSFDGGVLSIAGTSNDAFWDSPWQDAGFDFDELVASWNATTPPNTWITIDMQARGGGRTTKLYRMGTWTKDWVPAHRTSTPAQGDADGFIAIDTFIRSKKAAPLSEYMLRVGLHRDSSEIVSPSVDLVGAMTSAAVAKYDIPSTAGGARSLPRAVPQYSQEIHAGEFEEFDGGGEAWCSPTSTAMILDYWGAGPTEAELESMPGLMNPDGTPVYADPQVDYAARAVYDQNYQGAGNWPFNAAYAGSRPGLQAFVTRLRSLSEAELFIQAGIPLVASINGRLPGFFFGKTNGHLLTIVGFTASGDVISNDPAVPTNAEVQRTYGRADFEEVWLGGSGGIVYVIWDPARASLPANVGPNANW